MNDEEKEFFNKVYETDIETHEFYKALQTKINTFQSFDNETKEILAIGLWMDVHRETTEYDNILQKLSNEMLRQLVKLYTIRRMLIRLHTVLETEDFTRYYDKLCTTFDENLSDENYERFVTELISQNGGCLWKCRKTIMIGDLIRTLKRHNVLTRTELEKLFVLCLQHLTEMNYEHFLDSLRKNNHINRPRWLDTITKLQGR